MHARRERGAASRCTPYRKRPDTGLTGLEAARSGHHSDGMRLRSISYLLLLLALAACAAPEPYRRESNMRTNLAQLAQADTIVFLVPGALSSTSLFGPALGWGGEGTAVVEFRFPGFDDLPADRNVHILNNARAIAALANQYPDARIRLIGFSTGAAIAIEAAARMKNADIEVGAVSSAVPFPGMLGAGPRALFGLTRAATRVGTLETKEVWLEYFKILLFGWKWEDDPATRRWANAFVESFRETVVVPNDGLGRAHTTNLLVWTLSAEARAADTKIRFYHGGNDTIVPLRLVRRLADTLDAEVRVYRPDAHLLLLTRPGIIGEVGRDLRIPKALD